MAADRYGNETFYLVGISDSGTDSMIDGISINDITVNRNADMIMSPVERGYYVFDQKVLRPLTVDVNVTILENDWTRAWNKIVNLYENRSYKFCSVYTKGELIESLMLANLPRKETPDKYDAVDLTLNFVQVIIAKESTEMYSTRSRSDTSTKKTGQKSLTPSAIGFGIGNYIRQMFSGN